MLSFAKVIIIFILANRSATKPIGKIIVCITDITGNEIVKLTKESELEFSIDVSDLSPGTYIIKVSINNGYSESHKLIIVE